MPTNEPKNLEDLFDQIFSPAFNPYVPFINPSGAPAQHGYTTTTTTTSSTPKKEEKSLTPHEESLRVLKLAEESAKEIALPEVRAEIQLRIATAYSEL